MKRARAGGRALAPTDYEEEGGSASGAAFKGIFPPSSSPSVCSYRRRRRRRRGRGRLRGRSPGMGGLRVGFLICRSVDRDRRGRRCEAISVFREIAVRDAMGGAGYRDPIRPAGKPETVAVGGRPGPHTVAGRGREGGVGVVCAGWVWRPSPVAPTCACGLPPRTTALQGVGAALLPSPDN